MAEVETRGRGAAIARRKVANCLQQDIKLSLGQSQSLPDMLMTAPLAINLLGQIKLLAFTDEALRIRLTEPRGGFQHLQRTSLSSAMIQIVDQSADAFDTADKKMRAIRMQTNVMFGRNGHVQTILVCLQDQRMAKQSLLPSMSKFEQDMEKCARWANEIESQFDTLVKCAGEVNLAMADKLSCAAEEQSEIKAQKIKAEFTKEKQDNVLSVLKSRVEDAQSEFVKSRKQYQKTESKGEVSAIVAAAAIGAGSSFTGLINAAVSVFKDAPKVAIEAAQALSKVSDIGIGIRHSKENPVSAQAAEVSGKTDSAPVREGARGTGGLDPALLCAEQIETQLDNLNGLLNGELPKLVEEGGSELQNCVVRLKGLKKGLGGVQSIYTATAASILDEALAITSEILSASGQPKHDAAEWQEKISRFHDILKPLFGRATKLRAFAASLPGQGFGGSLDSPHPTSSTSDSSHPTLSTSGSTPTYDRVLHQRHQTLLIKRSAMNEARTNLEKQTERQLQAQAEIIDIARKMKDLAHKQTTIEDTKRILRKAIDVMVAMQDQVRQLTGFFNALASIISILCMGQAETYLATINAGLATSPGGEFLRLAHTEHQLHAIRETVVTLRGHFGYVVHSTDMYQEIATRHINPCIRMAANLPLSAGEAQQEEARRQLKQMTDASSEAIKALARHEMEAYQRDLDSRMLEIDEEIAALRFEPFEGEDEGENVQAIEEGVRASAEEVARARNVPMVEVYEEIGEDL